LYKHDPRSDASASSRERYRCAVASHHRHFDVLRCPELGYLQLVRRIFSTTIDVIILQQNPKNPNCGWSPQHRAAISKTLFLGVSSSFVVPFSMQHLASALFSLQCVIYPRSPFSRFLFSRDDFGARRFRVALLRIELTLLFDDAQQSLFNIQAVSSLSLIPHALFSFAAQSSVREQGGRGIGSNASALPGTRF
jgi:hypothetical protein